jgi:hypothetical protein
VHQLRGEPPVTTDTRGRPALREDSYWKLALPVASIAAARTIASLLGGGLKSPEQEWEARGFRACDGYDPEGNVIQVREGSRIDCLTSGSLRGRHCARHFGHFAGHEVA